MPRPLLHRRPPDPFHWEEFQSFHLETCRDLLRLLSQISPCNPSQSRVCDQVELRLLWLLRNCHPSQVSTPEFSRLISLRQRLNLEHCLPLDPSRNPA
jgi:hypothetical protein